MFTIFAVDFHFHESNDDKEVFSFSRIIEHVNRSAEATRNFYRDHTTSFHSSPIVQRLYKNGVHAYEHGQEYYDQFSETTIRYISENSSQLTKFVSKLFLYLLSGEVLLNMHILFPI